MTNSSRRRAKPAGAAPGTVVYIGESRSEPVHISYLQYDSLSALEPKTVPAIEVRRPTDMSGVEWFTVDGVHDTKILELIGANCGLHPLVLEDIANTRQRPKLEDFEDYIFIAMKMITYGAEARKLRAERQVGEGTDSKVRRRLPRVCPDGRCS